MNLKQLYIENCEGFDEYMPDGSCRKGLRMTLGGFQNALRKFSDQIESRFTKEQVDKEIYEALTVQALRMVNEVYQGGGTTKDWFINTYLNGLGTYEQKLAKKNGLVISKDF